MTRLTVGTQNVKMASFIVPITVICALTVAKTQAEFAKCIVST